MGNNIKSVALHNLGCKVNAYETEVMRQMLQEKGYRIAEFDGKADIYIVNTCTVTNIADRKSRQMLHRARALNPEAVVVAVGCYAQAEKERLLSDGSVDLTIGNNRKKDLVPLLEEYLAKREAQKGEQGPAFAGEDDLGGGCGYEEMTLKQPADHTRAYIKIQDGCNQFCSYCIIPYVRGRVRSRHPEDILEEIKGLVDAGYQEAVLTGIHISSYGTDFADDVRNGKSGLIDLLERIHGIEGLRRIRLGSLEPRIVTAENAARIAALHKVCPHFHLSLQSGCDATLKRMNRRYTTGEYCESVENLRRVFEHPAVSADVIVGFPGETQEEFLETVAFLEKMKLYGVHVFKYSRRKKTAAYAMADQISDEVKTERSSRLLALEREQSREFRSYYIGREAEVLFEETKELKGTSFWIGHTADYVKVALKDEGNLSNCLKKVHITDFLTDEILNCYSLD